MAICYLIRSASVPRLAEGIKSTDLHPSRLPRTTILPPFSWRWRGRSVGEGPVDPIALSPQQRNDKLDQFSRCLVDIEKERLKNLDLLQVMSDAWRYCENLLLTVAVDE